VALRPQPPKSPSGRAFEGAFEAALSVVVGLALGYYADRWLGTEPVLLFVFLIVGGIAGFRRLLRIEWPDVEQSNSETPRSDSVQSGDRYQGGGGSRSGASGLPRPPEGAPEAADTPADREDSDGSGG